MYKIWAKRFFKLLISVSMIVMVTTYIVDPFQQYRITSWYTPTKHKKREVAPGVAKNAVYEHAIISSSISENFREESANELFEGKSIRLCVSGVTPYELSNLVETALNSHPNLKTVVLSLDLYSFRGSLCP